MSNDLSALNPIQRSRDIEQMTSSPLDILVIGGGITGSGAALDAASRGLSVGLLEQRDYASGTSSRSSKLFHGGLRYLEQLNFGLVSEALGERNLMLKMLCPHLARPVSFVYPLRHRLWERAYVGVGVFIYDLMAKRSGSPLPRHEHISKSQLEEMAPAIDGSKFHGAVRYWDAQVDDARHTMMVARTAAAHGATLATSSRVVGLEATDAGVLVSAIDLESGNPLNIEAKTVINAAGVWSDDIQDLAGSDGLDVEASKGIHLVVPRDRIASETGMILRTKDSVLFVIPWDQHWIIGTTDTPWSLRRAHPAASKTDIDYVLGWINTVLAKPLRPDDVVGVYAGLRPLLTGESEETSKLSREHAVIDDGRGLISVAGGKYTTYRLMARDAVDVAARYLTGKVPESRTAELPLVGADSYRWAKGESLPADVSEDTHVRLLGRYGSLAREIYAILERRPELGDRVSEEPYMGAEIVYAATHEGALHLDDFLTRRTRISIETRHRGAQAAGPVSRLVSPLLGWDETIQNREIEHYRARVEAERDSQRQPDDRTADAARMGASDVRTGLSI